MPVSAAKAWNVMGNAVPPLLAKGVAEHIRDNLLMQPGKSFTVISTFSGGGGSSLGYHLAGGRVLAAVEWWPPAVEVYKANFPETPVICGDIAKVTAEELMTLAGVTCGQLDILDGSPPCQGFSTAGKRQVHDPRNSLFKEFVRLLDGLQPKVFVMENVSGMVKGQMKWVFAQALTALKACGYEVSCRLLNAMWFGVPQDRRRVIFIGVRKDLGVAPSHPKPRGIPVTVREAIGHLPLGVPGNHQPHVVAVWKRTRPGYSLRETDRHVGSLQCCRLNPDGVSRTQIKQQIHWHYAVPRKVTVVESGLLQSFPENYKWPVPDRTAHEVIGNSVPPLMMAAVAEHIRDNILARVA